jgi:transcription elongation factor Elf1
MQSSNSPQATAPAATRDIVFACSHCGTSFVVDAAAAGATLPCQNCGQPTVVPLPRPEAPVPRDAAKISDLQHQLKENESQRTEITGYINQLSIQLHRWQLRLKSLNERQQKLEAELVSHGGAPNK